MSKKHLSGSDSTEINLDKQAVTASQLGNKRGLDVAVLNKSHFGNFDKIVGSYPNTITEIYTYSYEGSDTGTITVSYTDATKCFLDTVVYAAI